MVSRQHFLFKESDPGADPAIWKGGVKSLVKGWAQSELVSEAGGAGAQSPPGENFERSALRMSILKF